MEWKGRDGRKGRDERKVWGGIGEVGRERRKETTPAIFFSLEAATTILVPQSNQLTL